MESEIYDPCEGMTPDELAGMKPLAGGGRHYSNAGKVDAEALRSKANGNSKPVSKENKRRALKQERLEPVHFESLEAAAEFLITKVKDPIGPYTHNELGLPKEQATDPQTLQKLARRNRKSQRFSAKRDLAVGLLAKDPEVIEELKRQIALEPKSENQTLLKKTSTITNSTLDIYTVADLISTIDSYRRATQVLRLNLPNSSLPRLENTLRQDLYSRLADDGLAIQLDQVPLEKTAILTFALAGNSVPEELQDAIYQHRDHLRTHLLSALRDKKNIQPLATLALEFVARETPKETKEAREQHKKGYTSENLKARGNEQVPLLGSQHVATEYLGRYLISMIKVCPEKLKTSQLAEHVTEVKLAREIQAADGNLLKALDERLQEELISRYGSDRLDIAAMRTEAAVGLVYVLTQGYSKTRDQTHSLRSAISTELHLRINDSDHSESIARAAVEYLTRKPLGV